jgi:hypothetical protein
MFKIFIGAGKAPAPHCAGPSPTTRFYNKKTEKRDGQQTGHHKQKSGKDTPCLRKETLDLIDAK